LDDTKWGIGFREQGKEGAFVLNFRFTMQHYDESFVTLETEIIVNYI